jgi:hypothetical protein
MIELFTLSVAPGSPLTAIADGERERNERRVSSRACDRPARPDGESRRCARSCLIHGWMRPDDGGYNRRRAAITVLDFRVASARNHFVRRVELLTSGFYYRRSSMPTAATLSRPASGC